MLLTQHPLRSLNPMKYHASMRRTLSTRCIRRRRRFAGTTFCCLHIKIRSDLCSVPFNIRTGPTDADTFLRQQATVTREWYNFLLETWFHSIEYTTRPTAHRRKKQCPPHTTCRLTRTRRIYWGTSGAATTRQYCCGPYSIRLSTVSRYAYTMCSVSPRFIPLAIVQKVKHIFRA